MEICVELTGKHLRRSLFLLVMFQPCNLQVTISFFQKNVTSFKSLQSWHTCFNLKLRFADFRGSHRGCSVRKGVLRNFAKFTRKHLYQSLSFNKVAGLRPAPLLKKRPWHRCFPVNFVKFVRTPFLTEHLRWLHLKLTSVFKNLL